MTPKHNKTNRYLEGGLFNGLKKFSDLEKRISKLPTENERGDAFEVFAEAYLATQTIMQAKEVYPFEKIPPPLKRKFRLDTKKDMGVDGLVQTTADEYHVYQVKFRSGRPSLTWTELSTFIGLTDKTDKKLVFTNCNAMPSVVENMDDVFFVRGNQLDQLEAQDFQQILNWLKNTPKPKPKKRPHDFQQEAIKAIEKALKGNTSKRATAVMACGTGKTLIALWVAEKLGYKKILVLVPSLALLSQTLHEWMKETSWHGLTYLCICSDPTVTKGVDGWEVRQSDVDFPVGTDSEVVREFLVRRTGRVKVVFSTYQSAQVVAEGMDGRPFDLGIFDEAHKTAGREGTKFGFALDDNNLPIKRRLFLTATPRHYNVLQKDKAGDSKLVYSMDDESLYGDKVYELPFAEASEKGIICDYKVLISVVTTDEVNEELLRSGEVLVQGDEVKVRQVANQLALKRATEKHPIKKGFTFHTFVKYAESFTGEGGEGLKAHMPEYETFHVSGSMPTALREELLREFEDAKRAVMSNARCLTEGVNVPVVDMVAFMSPKKSRVDIVQAVGRAMRKAGQKKRGYILIPLFLQKAKKESLEDALDRTDFGEVWDVLQAMAEQDAELTEIISQMVVEKGARGTRGYDDQRFRDKVETLGSTLSLDVLRRSITARCIERLGDSWDLMFGELVAFKKKHGDCLVPAVYDEKRQLGIWVGNTRQRRHRLSVDQIDRLDSIGFAWNPLEDGWEEMFNALKEFKDRHGHCMVPSDCSENPALGTWSEVQRGLRRKGKLQDDRVDRLDGLGFSWDPRDDRWEDYIKQLLEFKNEHGHCAVPRSYAENPVLARQAADHRSKRNQGRLSKVKIDKLDSIGFVWNLWQDSWEEMFRVLQEFKDKHGHCMVPTDYPNNPSLSTWVINQRNLMRRGELSQERAKRLERIGFVCSVLERNWDQMYLELTAFKKEQGHCNVPQKYVSPNSVFHLGTWVSSQRNNWRKGILSKDRIDKLNALGFVWEPRKRG